MKCTTFIDEYGITTGIMSYKSMVAVAVPARVRSEDPFQAEAGIDGESRSPAEMISQLDFAAEMKML